MMKLLVALPLLLANLALAEDAPATGPEAKKAENFEVAKKERVEMIEKHMAGMQEHKACVSGAKNWDEIAKCREKMKDMRMDWKEDRMGMQKDRMQKRMMRMDDRMQKMRNRGGGAGSQGGGQ